MSLATASAERTRRTIGHPSIVVSTPKQWDKATANGIHRIGAKAFRYIQYFWAPGNAAYEGVDLRHHPEWAFCTASKPEESGKPAVGRVVKGARWYFLDTNNNALRSQIRRQLVKLKAHGWDGVMFDRGQAATQYATDVRGRAIWNARSTCGRDAHRGGATFADAYVGLLELAQSVGLKVIFNNGGSPFDRAHPMRPEPKDPDCRERAHSTCRTVDDIWRNVDYVLDESAVRPRDDSWDSDFRANRRGEKEAAQGRHVIALLTAGSLGGAKGETRANVYYEWSRVRLFNLPVAVNTGDGGCASRGPGVCNHFGTFPELTDAHFGMPLSAEPLATGCATSSSVRCVWSRPYLRGMSVANVSPVRKRVRLALRTERCVYVKDLLSGRALAADRCVRSVRLDLRPWSGHPLTYRSHPW